MVNYLNQPDTGRGKKKEKGGGDDEPSTLQRSSPNHRYPGLPPFIEITCYVTVGSNIQI